MFASVCGMRFCTLWRSVQRALQSTVTISRKSTKSTLNFTIENLLSNGRRVGQILARTWWQLSTWWIGWAQGGTWPSQRWYKAVHMLVTMAKMANMPVRIGQEDSDGVTLVTLCKSVKTIWPLQNQMVPYQTDLVSDWWMIPCGIFYFHC